MEYFVNKDSIVRKIWGSGDTILLVFAGASAEFALNKAVDWLFYTGKLPANPLDRLFSTVEYARKIVFAEKTSAEMAIRNINAIHSSVENSRGSNIPQWAYRDVLFMLIDYSIRSYEVLEKPLTSEEKEEVFEVFYRMGTLMQIDDLPGNFEVYERQRKNHLQQHLYYGDFSAALYRSYREHLGPVRYFLLKQTQKFLLPAEARNHLNMNSVSILKPLLWLYRLSKNLDIDRSLRRIILPNQYLNQIEDLDHQPITT